MRTYFFDLDGTLCDSRCGLVYSFQAAFQALGIGIDDDRKIDRLLGAPLPNVFRKLIDSISDEAVEAGMNAFRRAYEEKGVYQTPLYPGAKELLVYLKGLSSPMWLVTLKPRHYALQIADNLGVTSYFSGIIGPTLAEDATKADLIAEALIKSGADPRHTIMLGDRSYDIAGAIAHHIQPVGALWGYGSKDELVEAGCSSFSRSIPDFRQEYVDQFDLPFCDANVRPLPRQKKCAPRAHRRKNKTTTGEAHAEPPRQLALRP